MCFYDKVSALVAWIREKTEQIPELGVILGSGLGGLADELEERVVIPYDEIPNFPRSRVEGHAGNLVIGSIGGQDGCRSAGPVSLLRRLLHERGDLSRLCAEASGCP